MLQDELKVAPPAPALSFLTHESFHWHSYVNKQSMRQIIVYFQNHKGITSIKCTFDSHFTSQGTQDTVPRSQRDGAGERFAHLWRSLCSPRMQDASRAGGVHPRVPSRRRFPTGRSGVLAGQARGPIRTLRLQSVPGSRLLKATCASLFL